MIKNITSPDLLCIGFFCHDLHKKGHILGGTASYSSLMCSHLGQKTSVLTSVGSDFKYFDIFEKNGIQIYNKQAPKTTVFQNQYDDNGKRTQYIHHRSETLYYEDLPEDWKQAHVVKFCLIADEVDISLLNAFPNALIGATIQGWLRQWNDEGKIFPKQMDWEILKTVDIVFMSEEDIEDYESVIPTIVEYVKILVLTKGAEGATIFYNNQRFDFPAFPVNEVDPTGAGDIFAASFLVQYHKTKDIALSAAFAHAAASYIVEDLGINIPSIQKINTRFNEYVKLFDFAEK